MPIERASNKFPVEANTKASTVRIQHCLPGTKLKDLKDQMKKSKGTYLKSREEEAFKNLSVTFASSRLRAEPPLPSNSGLALGQLDH